MLLSGYHHRDRYKHEYYDLDPVINAISFNTVQGFVINYGSKYSRRVDTLNNRYLTVKAKAGYGISDKTATGSVAAGIPIDSFTLGLNAGSVINDLNNTDPISAFVNSKYSLFRRINDEKFYQKQYLSASLDRRITGGWQANATSYSFFDPKGHMYTSNNPFLPDLNESLFPENQALTVTLRTTYDFSDKYETYPGGRRYLPSPYPAIGLSYIKGVNGILGSDVNYDQLQFDITKTNISLGILGQTSFYAAAGKFLNNSRLYYPDYKQFAGNELLLYKANPDSFLLLNYYTFSTYTEYVEGHLEHDFSGFILNKIPLIRKLKLHEILDVNYLSTSTIKNYTEIGFGLQYLNFRMMYGTSFNSGSNIHSAFRLGLSF